MKESRYNIWVERDGAKYVYNGVSGGLLMVPIDEYSSLRRFLAGDDDSGCSPALLADLAKGRMLTTDDQDELEFLARRYRTGRLDETGLGLTLVPSLGCNFDCRYCFEAKRASIMGEDVQEAILQLVDERLPRLTHLSVTWFGGEPLLGKRALLSLSDAFLERCDRAGVEFSAAMVTNGYLLDEETCGQLRDRRVENVQVTLDGPPDVHDRMRPLAGGSGSFWRIVHNLRHAVNYFDVAVRMNVERSNFERTEELLQILALEGFDGRLHVYPGQIIAMDDGAPSPSVSCKPDCFNKPEFATVETRFQDVAARHGFEVRRLPAPKGASCTAVRPSELVVGSEGELYKCWQTVGNQHEIVGDVRNYRSLNGRAQRWLEYDPFSNAECRRCVALPVCMGGCAHGGTDHAHKANRCITFRHTFGEQILRFLAAAQDSSAAGMMVG